MADNIQAGVSDVDKANIEGNTPLHIACKTGQIGLAAQNRIFFNLFDIESILRATISFTLLLVRKVETEISFLKEMSHPKENKFMPICILGII